MVLHWATTGAGVNAAPDYECSARLLVQHQ